MHFLVPRLEYLELAITRHTIHLLQQGSPNNAQRKCYVVSNLRKFDMDVCVVARAASPAQPPPATFATTAPPLALTASVVYEDGSPLRADRMQEVVGETDEVEPALHENSDANVECPLDGSAATLRLRMGKKTLSKAHENRNFRISLAPSDPSLRARFPHLTVCSEPLRVVTKLQLVQPKSEQWLPTS